MKKIKFSILIIISLSSISGFSQHSKLDEAEALKDDGKLEKAKVAIDEACKHKETSDFSRTWKLKGDIYMNLLLKNNKELIDENKIQPMLEMYSKAAELGPTNQLKGEIEEAFLLYRRVIHIRANDLFEKEEFRESASTYDAAIKMAELIKTVDSTAYFNKAISADRAGDVTEAINGYSECVKINFERPRCYAILIDLYQKQGNKEKANNLLKEAREEYPVDQSLLLAEINRAIAANEIDELVIMLKSAIKNDNSNKMLYYNLGTILTYAGKPEEAVKNFKEAIKLDIDYYDAWYQLGALSLNTGADLQVAARSETGDKRSRLISRSKEWFHNAIPALEEAYRIQPNELLVMKSLLQLYKRSGYTDKAAKMQKKIDKL